eukprot:2123057-Rhodomonas_salina.1
MRCAALQIEAASKSSVITATIVMNDSQHQENGQGVCFSVHWTHDRTHDVHALGHNMHTQSTHYRTAAGHIGGQYLHTQVHTAGQQQCTKPYSCTFEHTQVEREMRRTREESARKP